MQAVNDIFEAFGDSPSAIAKATGFPVQTVCDWRGKGKTEIPPWRRRAVLDAAKRLKIDLPAHCVEYLVSDARLPRAKQADAA
ncbi:hypothetical protein AL00_06200 [Sphingobium indicum F2]|uniref:Uncharacterized protein n=1 Tax=Sphingobium indicum F2 TaxID=1450518 RepID=A0A8E0WTQ7_9SPHN|nr:hypothetical protein AL00_06200 [Sphingobium indicum F2]